jgi:hypothetical protein
LLTIPVRVAGAEARFVFDTGIGVTLISQSLADRVGCRPDGSVFTGRRMSGHPVTIPMGPLNSLAAGERQWCDMPVGILDMQAMAGLDGIDGFVSLTCFRDTAVTVDYPAGCFVMEDPASLADRAAAGTPVSVEVRRDGWSTDLMLGIDLPGGRAVMVEVDTGSDVLILNSALAGDAGANLEDAAVRKVEGTDETGHRFVRYFTTLPGDISVAGAPQFTMTTPHVMFQEIIHDGLAGDKFLRNFITTYDLANNRMIFSQPSAR